MHLDMKHDSGDLTAKESLDLITSMIQEAKGHVRRNNFFFLLWGWVVVLANLGMYGLYQIEYSRPYLVWLITIPAWVFTIYKVFTRKRAERISTHFDSITGWLWMTYGITICCLVFLGYRINYQINPVILLVSAIPTIVSGVILNFAPLKIGGMTFWIMGIVCFLVTWETQPLVGALAIVCGYLVPGYMLRRKQN